MSANQLSRVARFMTMTAREGRGPDLADALLKVAGSLRAAQGCELYLISHEQGEPDIVHVTEQWRDQESVDRALAAPPAPDVPTIQEVIALLREPPIRMDLVPLGGVGA